MKRNHIKSIKTINSKSLNPDKLLLHLYYVIYYNIFLYIRNYTIHLYWILIFFLVVES